MGEATTEPVLCPHCGGEINPWKMIAARRWAQAGATAKRASTAKATAARRQRKRGANHVVEPVGAKPATEHRRSASAVSAVADAPEQRAQQPARVEAPRAPGTDVTRAPTLGPSPAAKVAAKPKVFGGVEWPMEGAAYLCGGGSFACMSGQCRKCCGVLHGHKPPAGAAPVLRG